MKSRANSIFDTPEGFIKAIPRSVKRNIEFRQKLHSLLAEDAGLQKIYLQMCLDKPQIAFDTMFFTLNPRSKPGERNVPFILRPAQITALSKMKYCIENARDMKLEKSRDEGATELAMKYFTLLFLLVPDTDFLVGSRKEEYVDKTGTNKTLFAKYDYAIKTLPRWFLGQVQPVLERNHMHARNLANNSTIDGEATNENFGAGGRASVILLDEFGRVEPRLAAAIKDTVHDVSDCVIYNSTHFYGTSHPFVAIGRDGEAEVVLLMWYDNPEKAAGLYASPEMNVIIVKDIKYYRRICPEVFNQISADERIIYSKFERDCLSLPVQIRDKLEGIKFIADGCEAIPGDLRSPWHDIQEAKRSRRDLCQNVWANPMGASDSVFDALINNRIKSQYCREPEFRGELNYLKKDGRITSASFATGLANGHLQWWGELDGYKEPNHTHNYIIGCDPSLGTGASNSVAAIVDVNTSQLVGLWTSPNVYPEEFADTVSAIAKWVGGPNLPYLIWENNGGNGINFGRRLLWHGFGICYTNRKEASIIRQRTDRYGWTNTRESKADLLGELQIALKEGLKDQRDHRAIIVYSEDLVDELNRYIYFPDGSIDTSEHQDETSGARSRHGDRVIAVALSVLGMKEQPKAVFGSQPVTEGSLAFRRESNRNNNKSNKDLY